MINLFNFFNHLEIFPNCSLVGRSPACHTNPLALGDLRGRNGLWEGNGHTPVLDQIPHPRSPQHSRVASASSACPQGEDVLQDRCQLVPMCPPPSWSISQTKKIHLGLQLLRDRKQLKNCPWPLSSAKRAVQLQLLPHAVLQMCNKSHSWHRTRGQGHLGCGEETGQGPQRGTQAQFVPTLTRWAIGSSSVEPGKGMLGPFPAQGTASCPAEQGSVGAAASAESEEPLSPRLLQALLCELSSTELQLTSCPCSTNIRAQGTAAILPASPTPPASQKHPCPAALDSAAHFTVVMGGVDRSQNIDKNRGISLQKQ